MSIRNRDKGQICGRWFRAAAPLAFAAALAGCSALPDEVRTGPIYGENMPAATPEGSSGFPNLNDVPGEKPVVTAPAQREKLAADLAADRSGTRGRDADLQVATASMDAERPAPAATSAAPAAAPESASTAQSAPAPQSAPVAQAEPAPSPTASAARTQSTSARASATEQASTSQQAPTSEEDRAALIAAAYGEKKAPTAPAPAPVAAAQPAPVQPVPVQSATVQPAPTTSSAPLTQMASAASVTPVEPLTDVPEGALTPPTASGTVIAFPKRGGHATLAAARGVEGAPDAPLEEAKPNPETDQPVTSAPTTPVEVQPSGPSKP